MSGPAEIATTVVVVTATLALAAGVLSLTRIRDSYAKVQAISMGIVLGPSLTLLATLFSGDLRLILPALLVIVFLVVTAGVAAHAIVRIQSKRGDSE